MKSLTPISSRTRISSACGFALSACAASAQIFVFNPGLAVPDGTGTGLADRRTVNGAPSLATVRVGITLSGSGDGMVNGDLYATLSHENAQGQVDAFAVLLNRPGKRLDNDEGYFDNGLSIDLVASDLAPDVHNYRVTLGGSHTMPLGGPLTGTWSADGRLIDPEHVLDSDLRTAGLEAFTGIDPNSGRWVLFVADLLEGGEARLDQWSLSFTAVPEPVAMVSLTSLVLVGWRLGRGRRIFAATSPRRALRDHRRHLSREGERDDSPPRAHAGRGVVECRHVADQNGG